MAITLDRLDPADASAIRGTALYAMEQVEEIVSVNQLDGATVLIEALVEQLEALGASYQEIVGLIASIAEKLNERAKALARSILTTSFPGTARAEEASADTLSPRAGGSPVRLVDIPAGTATGMATGIGTPRPSHIRLVASADDDDRIDAGPPPLQPIDSDHADWTDLGVEDEADILWARLSAGGESDASLTDTGPLTDPEEPPRRGDSTGFTVAGCLDQGCIAGDGETGRKRFEPTIPWVLSSHGFRTKVTDALCRTMLDYWDSQCNGRRMPSRRQLDPTRIGGALKAVGLIDVLGNGDRFRYRLVGRQIGAFFGTRANGLLHDRVPLGPFGTYLAHLYRSAAATRRPLYVSGGVTLPVSTRAPLTMLLLPLASDNRAVDMLMMTMNVMALTDADQPLPSQVIIDKDISCYTYE